MLIVGLAPAANGANRTGRMFTGDHSGDVLFAALHRTGWASQPVSAGGGDGMRLDGLRIVAAVRCAPPGNAPTGEERAACRPWLVRDLELAAPRLTSIVCLGALAWDATLAAAREAGWSTPRPKPAFGHAARAALGTAQGRAIAMIGCYHVSPHNTFTGRLTPDMLDEVLRSVR